MTGSLSSISRPQKDGAYDSAQCAGDSEQSDKVKTGEVTGVREKNE
jgi:hypothetical protein